MEPLGEISNERWEMIFAVNTTAVMKSMRLAVNLLLEQEHGTIVNNISAGGLYGGRAGAVKTTIGSSMKNMSRFGAGRQSQGMSLNPRAGRGT